MRRLILCLSFAFAVLWLFRPELVFFVQSLFTALSCLLLVAASVSLLRWVGDDLAGLRLLFVRRTPNSDTLISVGRTMDDLSEWERALLMAAFVGNRGGFQRSAMLPYMSQRSYEKLMTAMLAAGVLADGRAGRTWADGWNYPRFKSEVKHNVLSLPCPTDGKMPVVSLGGVPGKPGKPGRPSEPEFDD